MASVENPLHHGENSLHRSPPAADALVPEPVPDTQGMTPRPALHGGVVASGLDAEVALVPVRHLPMLGEVDTAVVHRRRGGLQVPDEAPVDVRLHVKLVPEGGPLSPLRPVPVPAPAGPGLLASGLRRLSRVCGDEAGVLGDALPDPQHPLVQLPLQLLPDQPVSPLLGEALPELPHRGVVGDGFRIAQEPPEAEAVSRLPLQLGVAEAVPVLEDQELHHHYLVYVEPVSPGSLVVVYGADYRPECLPFYEDVHPGQPVAKLLGLLVGYLEHVGLEGDHACWMGVVIKKVNRWGAQRRYPRSFLKTSVDYGSDMLGLWQCRVESLLVASQQLR